MTLEKAKLDNGLTVYADRMASSLDNTVTVSIPFGSVNEASGEEGIAHVIEHCVHLKTDDFESQQKLDRYAEVNGIVANASTNYTYTQYYANGLGIEANMHYLSQVLQHTHMPEHMVGDELGVIRREAKMALDDPEELHYVAAQNALFGHPYGRDVIGYHDKIDFDTEALHRLHKQHYKLGNMALVVTGSAKFDEVVKLAETYFVADGEYIDSKDQLESTYGEYHRTGYVLEDANNVQATVSYPITPEFRETYLANKFAYSIAMRAIRETAFRSLRQEKGISYNGSASFTTYNHPNAWSIDGDVTTDAEHVAVAEETFQAVFSRESSKYHDDEIKGALEMYRYGQLKGASTPEGRAGLYLGRLRIYGEPEDAMAVKRQVMKVTEADVRAGIDAIVAYTQSTPAYTHLTGTREDIGDVERIIEQSDII